MPTEAASMSHKAHLDGRVQLYASLRLDPHLPPLPQLSPKLTAVLQEYCIDRSKTRRLYLIGRGAVTYAWRRMHWTRALMDDGTDTDGTGDVEHMMAEWASQYKLSDRFEAHPGVAPCAGGGDDAQLAALFVVYAGAVDAENPPDVVLNWIVSLASARYEAAQTSTSLPNLDSGTALTDTDHVSILNAMTTSMNNNAVEWRLSQSGPDHFNASVSGEGTGSSIQTAKNEAARRALDKMHDENSVRETLLEFLDDIFRCLLDVDQTFHLDIVVALGRSEAFQHGVEESLARELLDALQDAARLHIRDGRRASRKTKALVQHTILLRQALVEGVQAVKVEKAYGCDVSLFFWFVEGWRAAQEVTGTSSGLGQRLGVRFPLSEAVLLRTEAEDHEMVDRERERDCVETGDRELCTNSSAGVAHMSMSATREERYADQVKLAHLFVATNAPRYLVLGR
ncbi:hypothetical protein EXIGLDRAFT_690884 [Exidia glandulosa HHB12029]|uniref:DRBM domain-containing protein n=1 Tax=Exidia glandulosa HHB12029 TaxID=1314781 RepID=A0A165R099_EXIGL|nr:hypothetical protein EXIGLDRAFT_690884 [Exidia glandulosa HHB12029]